MNSTVALEILQKWFTQWKCTEFPALFNHCHSMGVAEDFHITLWHQCIALFIYFLSITRSDIMGFKSVLGFHSGVQMSE